jgi:hypothetical protein
LEVNLAVNKHSVDVYLGIFRNIIDYKAEIKFEFYQLEHKMWRIIQDERDHITELKLLLVIK